MFWGSTPLLEDRVRQEGVRRGQEGIRLFAGLVKLRRFPDELAVLVEQDHAGELIPHSDQSALLIIPVPDGQMHHITTRLLCQLEADSLQHNFIA